MLPHEAERGDRGVTLLTVVFISSVILLRLAIMPAVDEGGGPASSIAKSGAKIRIEPVGDVSFAGNDPHFRIHRAQGTMQHLIAR